MIDDPGFVSRYLRNVEWTHLPIRSETPRHPHSCRIPVHTIPNPYLHPFVWFFSIVQKLQYRICTPVNSKYNSPGFIRTTILLTMFHWVIVIGTRSSLISSGSFLLIVWQTVCRSVTVPFSTLDKRTETRIQKLLFSVSPRGEITEGRRGFRRQYRDPRRTSRPTPKRTNKNNDGVDLSLVKDLWKLYRSPNVYNKKI